jgi:hypothetical protein
MTAQALGIQRLVVSEGGRFPELGRIFYESGPRVVRDRMAAYFGDLMDLRLLRRADPKVAAQHFIDLAISAVYWPALWGVSHDPTSKTADPRVICGVETFLRAYSV